MCVKFYSQDFIKILSALSWLLRSPFASEESVTLFLSIQTRVHHLFLLNEIRWEEENQSFPGH